MTFKDIFLHLRFPFSFFLMPIYWLALSQQTNPDFKKNILIFIVLHVFVYPASNAFNSYFDKDEDSIGGLKNPPKVDIKLWYTANFFDLIALILAFFTVNFTFGFLVLLYVLVSRMYSHPIIRLKKYAILSWLVVGMFQGALVFMLTYIFGQNLSLTEGFSNLNIKGLAAPIGMAMAAFILWAIYPITQVYQHKSDEKNGDHTMSRLLGINGTFISAIVFFSISLGISYFYLPTNDFLNFFLFCGPIAGFMLWWFLKVIKNQQLANFKHTMQMNIFSSVLLNICFLINCLF
jgi:4-hydroxybenzoate polyprenyltransferase